MTLGLFTMNGRYDVNRLLLRGHDDALQWADKLFEHYLKRAKEVDLEESRF
jgi:predicted transcriptional regulator